MNFLAHLVLAPPTARGRLGSIAPDMIRGPLPSHLDAQVVAAAREHQRIDAFTDAHPAFLRTRDRLRGVVDPRLAGVLADVLYDHVLASRWSTYRDEPFAPFVDRVQRDLFDHRHLVPRRMRLIIDTMIEQGWLASYATPSGIRARLDTMSKRLSRRLSRPMSLVISAEQLESHLPDLADDFAELWPDLIDCVDRSRVGSIDRLAS